MSKLDSKWKKSIKDYINNMSEEEFQAFLEETDFEFYNNVKTPVLAYLDAVDTALEKSTWFSLSWVSMAAMSISPSFSIESEDFHVRFEEAPSRVICSGIGWLTVGDEQIQYKLAA